MQCADECDVCRGGVGCAKVKPKGCVQVEGRGREEMNTSSRIYNVGGARAGEQRQLDDPHA